MASDKPDTPESASSNTFLRKAHGVAHARRTRRIGLGLLIFLVVVGLLGFFGAPPLVRHIAEQQLSKQLDRPATIGGIAFNPYTLRLEADQIHIGEKGGAGSFVDIGKLVVRPSWASIWHLAPVIGEVKLESPRFHIVRYDAQRFNFSDIVDKFSKPSPTPSTSPTRFAVSNIQVSDGRIEFDDQYKHEQHVIDQWSLGIPFIANLKSKLDVFVTPQLHARFDGSPIDVVGKTKPFAQTLESQVQLKLNALDVPRLMTYAPTKLPVTVQSGKLSSDLGVDFSMQGDTPAVNITGTVDLADARVTDNSGAPLFAAQALHVAAAQLEPLHQVLHFSEIRLDKPVVNVTRDSAGRINLTQLGGAQSGAAPAAASEVSAPKAEAKAKPAAPLDLSVAHLAINDGTVQYADASTAKPVKLALDNLALDVSNFALTGKQPAHYTLALDVAPAQGKPGSLKSAGSFDLGTSQADPTLTLADLPLTVAGPYLSAVSAAQLQDGTLGADVKAHLDWSKDFAAQVTDSTLTLASLKVALPKAATPAIVLPQAQIKIKSIDTTTHLAQLAGVAITGLALDVKRLHDGSIDLASLAGKPGGSGASASNAPAHTAAKPASASSSATWHYTIDTVTLDNGQAKFTDQSTPRPVKLALAPLQLSVSNVSDDLSKPLPVTLKTTVNRKGTLRIDGKVIASPLKLKLTLDGHHLDAAAFEPYFASQLNATIASALLNAKGTAEFVQTPMHAHYQGDLALVDVHMLDKATSDPFAGWGALALNGTKVDYDAKKGADVNINTIDFSKFYGRVLLSAQGKLNLKDVVAAQPGTGGSESLTRDGSGAQPVPLTPGAASGATAPLPASVTGAASAAASVAASAAQAAASAAASATSMAANAAVGAIAAATGSQAASSASSTNAAAASAASGATASASTTPPARIHIGRVVLQSGQVNYTDNFIKPNYSADLVAIAGTVGAIGTDTTTAAPVNITANLAGNGPLSIKGTVNPLIAQPALDLTAAANDIELTNLTPYSTKYTGYPIVKGKLNVNLHYQLANNQLKADNHVFIDQLTFGQHVDNDTETHLPVQLAISLLKNSAGQIDVNIPVSGSLSDPQFSVGSLVWHAVLNLIEKAVTAPFSLLANAFGGGGEDLGYVAFAPGTAVLSDAAKQKLDTVVKMLSAKPSINLDVIGRVDPAQDASGLQQAAVDRLVRQEKIKDTVGQGESVDTSTVQVTPDEYPKYLTRAYKDADFKKPRNFIGLQKTLPEADMKAALEAHAASDQNALRALAQARAQAVQQYLQGKVDAKRIFMVAPKLDAKGISDKGPTTRVDLGLQ